MLLDVVEAVAQQLLHRLDTSSRHGRQLQLTGTLLEQIAQHLRPFQSCFVYLRAAHVKDRLDTSRELLVADRSAGESATVEQVGTLPRLFLRQEVAPYFFKELDVRFGITL